MRNDPVTWEPHDVRKFATRLGLSCSHEEGVNGGVFTFGAHGGIYQQASTFAALCWLRGYQAGIKAAVTIISSQVEHDREEGAWPA